METGGTGHEDHVGESGVRPYPAQSRPEQPMHLPQSSWPWVVGGVVIMVALLGGLLLWVMYEIGSNAG